MKKLLTAVLLLLPIFKVEAQPALWWGANTITTNVNGGAIVKNDTISLEVKLNPNFSTIRSVFFDFQHQKDAITLLDVQPGAGIPQGANFTYTNNYYPNCKFNRNANNTTDTGWNNYMNASYTCNSVTVPYHAINRINVNVSSAANMEHATYIKLRFRIAKTDAGFPYDSVYMNFAIGYDVNGQTMTNTQNVGAKGVWIQLAPNANNLVVGDVKHSANVSAGLKGLMRLSVTDTMTQPTEVTNAAVGGNGQFSFAQQLQVNTPYRFRVTVPADSLHKLSLAATTISDFTAAQQEWITQNLDRTFKNNNINKGMKYWAADVNNNGEFDGGDLQVLFNAVTGLDTIMVPPAGCAANCSISIPLFYGADYDNTPLTNWDALMSGKIVNVTPGQTEWAIINLNGYGAGQTRFYVDMRQFPAGVTPSSVKWMNILDVYNGPVTWMSQDGAWAFFKVASNFTKATNGTSAYNANIRNVNNQNVDYAISSTISFVNKTPGYVFARTTTGEQTLDLRYALKGDVNLSHSSLVTEQQAAIYGWGNLVVPDGRSIDTKVNNVVVTGDTINIPFNVDTKGIALSGLQYEVKIDPTLVKFVKMNIDTPSWISFVHPMADGTIRFGAVDKDLKNPLTGANLTPFKLQLVALKAGVDLNTSVVLTQVMDAADNKGNQVGINLSSTVIRLVGISNFR
jgi:hypothetical protein